MKAQTLTILQKVKNGELTPQMGQESLFVLFGVSNRACANCKLLHKKNDENICLDTRNRIVHINEHSCERHVC